MTEPIAGRETTSQCSGGSEEFASNADLSGGSSLSQFIHSSLPLTAIKDFANQLTSRRRRKTCPPKCPDGDDGGFPSAAFQDESSRSSAELSSTPLDDTVHIYVGRYMRDTRHFLRHNINKKFKPCDLNERLRCRREQGPLRSCGSCSWAHGDSSQLEPRILPGTTPQLFRFVGDAKRLLHHSSAYVTPYVYVFGGLTANGRSGGLWALNVCDGYWRHIQQSREKPPDSEPPYNHHHAAFPPGEEEGSNLQPLSSVTMFGEQMNSTGVMWGSPDEQLLLPASFPESRFSHSLDAYKDKELILFGGDRGPGELNDLWRFDVLTRTWTVVDDFSPNRAPPPRSGHGSAIWRDKLLIFGGAGGLEMFDDLWSYDLIKNEWTEIECAAKPEGRSGHTCGVSENKLFVFGGSSFQSVYGDVWCVDLSDEAKACWRKVETRGPAPTPRSRHTGLMIEPHEWLIFGGKHGAFCYNCDLFTLNTESLIWRKEIVFRPARSHSRHWWNAPEIIRQLPQLHCHSMSYDFRRGILVVTGGCDGDGSAKDSTLLIKRASTASIVFEEWLQNPESKAVFSTGSLPRFINEHYDPYAFELLKYL